MINTLWAISIDGYAIDRIGSRTENVVDRRERVAIKS